MVRLGGPKAAGAKLHLSGFAPVELLDLGPVHFTVKADGEILQVFTLEKKELRQKRGELCSLERRCL